MKTSLERFWEKVDKTDTCWLWFGSKTKGYGKMNINHHCVYAHRFIWEETYGPIPEGLMVLHHCDNPPCVKPSHLFLGTASDNEYDSVNKGRHFDNAGEKHPLAKLTAIQVREIRLVYIPRILPFRKLASQYNVSQSTIQQVLNRRTWRVEEL